MGLNENSMKFNNKMLKQKQCVINYKRRRTEEKKTHSKKERMRKRERDRERINKGDREKSVYALYRLIVVKIYE